MSRRFQVIITDFLQGDLSLEHSILSDIADVVTLNAHSEQELAGRIEEADAVMLYHSLSLTASTIQRLSRCKLIVRCGVGYDNVDRAAARTRGIPVANVPDYGTEEVADSAIGLMLALTRGIHKYDLQLKRGGPFSYAPGAPLVRLRGRVLGLIGLGRIGMATALRARALGMSVLFYDPYTADGTDKALGLRRIETRDEMLPQCHVLSLHCPLTPETRGIVGAAEVSKLPRGSYLVNTARGACVDLDALPEAIRSGQLAGAGIDVFPQEPPLDDHPLLKAWRDPNDPCHDRVILNPHTAFYSEEGLSDMRRKGAESCRRALLGEPLRNIVN